MRKLVLSAALLLMAAPAGAQESAPVTLRDVIRSLSTSSSVQAASTALTRAAEMTQHASTAPRLSFATATGVEPDTGGIRFRATEQIVLDLGSGMRRLGDLAVAQSQLATSSATLSATRRMTASAAIGSYFAVLTDQVQVATQRQALTTEKQSVLAAMQRLNAGSAPQIDVERARAILATSQAELDSAKSELADDGMALATLIGRSEPVAVMTPERPTAIADATSVTTAALRTNPNVTTARAAYAASEAALLIARAQLEPGVSVGAGIGFTRLAGQQQVGPAVSLSVDFPVSSRLAKANVAAAQAAIFVAKAALEQAERDAVQAALRARSSANAALARLQELKSANDAAGRVAEAELKAYRIGAVGGADLLVALTQANAANAAVQTTLVQLAEAQASLQFETGDFAP